MYKLSEELAIVQSLDFFTPIVDDPYTFGQITAANALSDIYAMGAKPITALNIVAFPIDDLPKSVIKDILRGGLNKIDESGAVLAGGHSIKDDELKYGLSVTGVVHPDKLISNKGAMPGDKLILTKALGTGILATALKRKLASADQVETMVNGMIELNKVASEVAITYPIHAMTDVTGFGLTGHLLEMLNASCIDATLHCDQLPLLPGTLHFAEMGVVPGGLRTNRKYYSPQLIVSESVGNFMDLIVVDPQTSGGLLIACPPEAAEDLLHDLQQHHITNARIIGEIASESSAPRITLI